MTAIEQGTIPVGDRQESRARVNDPIQAHLDMMPAVELINDILGGTSVMRERGEKRMPMYSAEKRQDWQRRLDQAILFPGLERAIARICAKPFSQEVTIENAAPWMEELATNVDGQGTTLTQYGLRAMWLAAAHGMMHSLIDFPPAPEEGRSGADRPRPRWDLTPVDTVIGWRSTAREEVTQLTRTRIAGSRMQPAGTWGETQELTITVLHADGNWELWVRNIEDRDGDYRLDSEGRFDYPEGVPLNTLYFRKTGFMTAVPPLLPVANMNDTHWKSSSRQRQYLDFARLGLVFFSGVAAREGQRLLEVGPHGFNWSENPDAKLQIEGHPTQAIEAGERDLAKLEQDMDAAGLEPMKERSGNPTATGRAIDEAKINSDVKAWIRATEAHLLDNFKTSGAWSGDEVPEDAQIRIFSDFGLSLRAGEDTTEIREWVNASLLTQRTGLMEIQRRAVISDTVDIDAEVAETERARAEAAATEAENSEPDGSQPEDDDD